VGFEIVAACRGICCVYDTYSSLVCNLQPSFKPTVAIFEKQNHAFSKFNVAILLAVCVIY
jgi:hypothetical protein